MNTTQLPQRPDPLIRTLFDADRSGRLALPAGSRDLAFGWLRRIVVDFDALDDHLALLGDLQGEPLTFERPSPWSDDSPSPVSLGSGSPFRHRDPLPDERIVDLADHGISVLNNEELAGLLLNPVALTDLARVIDELSPAAWHTAWNEVGREWVEAALERLKVPLVAAPMTDRTKLGSSTAADETTRKVPGKLRIPTWVRRWSPAIAASLLLGLAVVSRGFRASEDDGAGRVWSARADLVGRGTRGDGESLRVKIDCEFDGFATIVGLFPDGRPEVSAGSEDGLIHVKPGEPVETLLPKDWKALANVLVVITPTPSDEVIRQVIYSDARPEFFPNEVDKLELFLRGWLEKFNHHQVATARPGSPIPPK